MSDIKGVYGTVALGDPIPNTASPGFLVWTEYDLKEADQLGWIKTQGILKPW